MRSQDVIPGPAEVAPTPGAAAQAADQDEHTRGPGASATGLSATRAEEQRPGERPASDRSPNLTEENTMKHSISALATGALALVVLIPGHASESPEAGLTLTPEQMAWKPNPRVPGLGVANIIGSGKKPGPFVYRVKFPNGRVVQPHSHPDDRTYTVISGTWYIGWGEKYDASRLIRLGPGSFYTEPAGVPHFVSTPEEETVVQITGTGPTSADFVDPAHAPKK